MIQPGNRLLERIRELQEAGETGLLSIGQRGQVITVFFRDGLISAVSTNIPEHQLGQYLTKHGYLDQRELVRLVDESRRRHTLLGETAVARTVLDDAELVELVQSQAAQVLAHALRYNYEIRSFDRSAPPSFFMPARIDHMHLMLEMARCNLRPFKIEPGALIGLRNGKALPPLPWYPAELSVITELKQPKTVHELAAATGLEYPRLAKVLFVLDSLNLVTRVQSTPSESTALVRRDGFPYESVIPEIRRTGLSDKLEVVLNESSFVSEQFKTLKVRLSELGRQLKVITVCSPDMKAGKTLISVNLAASFARDPGRKVIILDCDFRNPSLHKYLGVTPEPGLLGYLEGDYLQSYCYMRRLDKMYVLTAGVPAPNPVELLLSDRMRGLIDYLRIEFDTIIIDAPPLEPISDSQILAGMSDGTLLVVRSGKTTYGGVEKALKNLDQRKLLGVVFNDVKPRLFNTQYDHRYYSYGGRTYYPYRQTHAPRPRRKTYLE